MYTFGRSEFGNELWIKNGELFSNVTLVEVEMINNGDFRLDVVSAAGTVVSTGHRSGAGWQTFDFHAGMNPPVVGGMSPYKLRFVNASAGKRQVRAGRVSP